MAEKQAEPQRVGALSYLCHSDRLLSNLAGVTGEAGDRAASPLPRQRPETVSWRREESCEREERRKLREGGEEEAARGRRGGIRKRMCGAEPVEEGERRRRRRRRLNCCCYASTKLVSVAAQKFIADVAHDALQQVGGGRGLLVLILQQCKMRNSKDKSKKDQRVSSSRYVGLPFVSLPLLSPRSSAFASPFTPSSFLVPTPTSLLLLSPCSPSPPVALLTLPAARAHVAGLGGKSAALRDPIDPPREHGSHTGCGHQSAAALSARVSARRWRYEEGERSEGEGKRDEEERGGG
eukprot:765783-Hanusia_phi.AAC.3